MQDLSFTMALESFDRQDYKAALSQMLPLARLNNAEAQCIIGNIYQLGLGVEPDLSIALEWYTQASQQGHGLATSNRAGIILIGYNDIPPNPIEAARLYNEARKQGFEHAPIS
jgi:TPR repeat protein